MNIIDTSDRLLSVFESGKFSIDKWGDYMDQWIPGAKELCLEDMRATIKAGYTWEKDFLPILHKVLTEDVKRREIVSSFRKITEGLDERITKVFGRSVDVDVMLYLGLCNGAGWVTSINGRTAVLLGMEKIMELGWGDINSMTGLIVHELGHAYQAQYGRLEIEADSPADRFIWQLFTEGVAMVFEQEVAYDRDYYHQDRKGWKNWCEQNAERIRISFYDDLKTMTQENQRYFGDWVSFEGYGDTGYYLGTLFVRYLLRFDSFDSIIQYGIAGVKKGFEDFMASPL